MTLEEAIKHAEEVAKGNEDSAKEYYRIANLEYHPNKKEAENAYVKCMECHKEHRQLAEWLKELKKYREENHWIPFTYRTPTEEEKEDHPDWGCVLDCKLPEDGQRILVNIKYKAHEAVQPDEFYYDSEGCYLDSGYDIGTEATAWRPLPEPYRGEQK